MEKTNKHEEYIAHLVGVLNDESMSVIDFDRLNAWLGEIGEQLSSCEDFREQLQVLREDYTQRIAGMVKAMAALERRTDSWDQVLSFIESLSSLTALQLTDCYRKTSARFRDSFPASFGLLREPRNSITQAKEVSVHK